MFRKFWICGSTSLIVCGAAAAVFGQAAAAPPSPPAKDREPHYISRPQETTPRVRSPNTDALGNKAAPPSPDNPVLDPDDLESTREAAAADAKPSEIRSTVSTPRTKPVLNALQVDTMLATYAALANHEQILLAEIAGERAQSSGVKDYAAMLSHQHIEFLDRLKKFAPEATRSGYLKIPLPPLHSTEVVTREATLPRVLPSKAIDDVVAEPPSLAEETADAAALELPAKPIPTNGSAGRVIHLLQIERLVASLNLAAEKDLLDQKRGQDFDKFYLNQQIARHLLLRSQFAAYQGHVSRELGAAFAEGEAMANQHLTKAQELLKAMEPSRPALGLAPPSRNSRVRDTAEK